MFYPSPPPQGQGFIVSPSDAGNIGGETIAMGKLWKYENRYNLMDVGWWKIFTFVGSFI